MIGLIHLNTTTLFNHNYRYGFNGMEKDDAVKGAGNSYDFGARIYDSRLGRFISVDPQESSYSFMSPYCYAANTPILFVDEEGEGPGLAKFLLKKGGKVWVSVAKSVAIQGLKRGSWVKVVSNSKTTRAEAKKLANTIWGKGNFVEHTSHTVGKNSKKITKPHFQPKAGEGKVFYKASLALIAGKESEESFYEAWIEPALDFGGELLVEIIIDVVSLGGVQTANAPSLPLNFEFKRPRVPTLSNMPEGTSDSELGNDVDGDGITDDMDYVCNGCGSDGENLIGLDGQEGSWAVIDDELADTYQNGTNEQREAIFDYYNDELKTIESEDDETEDSSSSDGDN